VELRRLASHEVAPHRDLRLRALRDAPDSFGETFAAAAVRPISYWEELTRSVTEPGRDVMFLACEGDDVLGRRTASWTGHALTRVGSVVCGSGPTGAGAESDAPCSKK